MKIREIEARSPYYVPLLYKAAWKVFGIPPWDSITAALDGDFTPLKNYLEQAAENLKGTPFSPPRVWQQIMSGALRIRTDGGREIYVAKQEALVDFVRDGEGSVVAAGEVIAHLREALETMPGQNGISVLDDQYHTMTLGDYTGPVHPRLSRVTYDSDFAIAHPALLVACAKASGEGAVATLCPWGLSDEQFQEWIANPIYSIPVLASCTSGDTQELIIKGSALEVAEQLASKRLIALELIPELVEAIAADIDEEGTNMLSFGDLEVTVVDTHVA